MSSKTLYLVLTGLALAGCDEEPVSPLANEGDAPNPDIGVVLDRRAPSEQVVQSLLGDGYREEIGDYIAHYQFDVPLGPGEFDVVRIHRVVRERRPYRPVRTEGAVFMTHGASLNFEAIFLNAGTESPNAATSVAVNLASQGIDVWGMDFAWTLVPLETTDFSFMQDWGLERDAAHTRAAMSIARLIRGLTHQGFGRINLLGYSYGVGVAYAAAGAETQERRWLRDIKGIIAVDQVMKFDSDPLRQASCADADAFRAQLDAGTYQDDAGIGFGVLSTLAQTAPDDPSPIIPGFTNLQAILFVGTTTFATGPTPAPFFHFVGGEYDANGIPVGLLYSEIPRWTGLGASLPPYMPNLARYDLRVSQCDQEETSIDDNLGAISVPILYLGAEGGVGTLGDYTSSVTASDDVTNVNVQVLPGGQTPVDYGHADLFIGNDAERLAWDTLRRWIVEHSRPRRSYGKRTTP